MDKGQALAIKQIPRKERGPYTAEELLEQKAHIVRSILAEIRIYCRAYPPYIPAHLFSNKYSRICVRHGGFASILLELEAMGSIRIVLNELNVKLIYLTDEDDDDGSII